MECPHLCDSVKVNRDFIKQKIVELNAQTNGTPNAKKGPSRKKKNVKLWKCLECTSDKENWMCLNCGQVLCGRYENGHALNHSTINMQHNVCLNTLNQSVYCYKCDDFVVNETNLLATLREELDESSSEGSNDEYSSRSTRSTTKTSSNSPSSSDSGWYDESTLVTDIALHEAPIRRCLRPRKRTSVNDQENEPLAKKKKKFIGLKNLGNTCFMNSVLQSLNTIDEFSQYIMSLPEVEPNKPRPVHCSRSTAKDDVNYNLVEELRKVLIDLNQGGDGSTALWPNWLFTAIWKLVPQYRGHRQHDAHEFLRYMLDRLHNELQIYVNQSIIPAMRNSTSGVSDTPKESIVTNIFDGTLQSEVRCLVCGMVSKKHDPFLDLSLDIPTKFYKTKDSEDRPVCDISDCLSSFIEVEELAETELYYCSSCECKQKSTKRFWIRRLPNVLCLHIKRFRWNNYFRTKIDSRIDFPIRSLDMSKYVLREGGEPNQDHNIYDLSAVIMHHGNGSSCGHYTAMANHNGSWIHYNDHIVNEVNVKDVIDCKPYILFYSRRKDSARQAGA